MAVETIPYQLIAAGGTDMGLVREANEDAWRQFPELNLFVLADGMGGHKGGDVAANEAVNRVCNIIKRELHASEEDLDLEEAQAIVYDAIQEVNEQVHGLGQSRKQLRGMGTTLCVLFFFRDWAIVAHVGDSRIYRLSGTTFSQLTADHSLFQELVDGGTLGKDEEFARKHIITKAIGVALSVEPTLQLVEVRPGDRFLLCSDGLTDLVEDSRIGEMLGECEHPQSIVERMIAAANGAGGIDNTTIIAVHVEEAHA